MNEGYEQVKAAMTAGIERNDRRIHAPFYGLVLAGVVGALLFLGRAWHVAHPGPKILGCGDLVLGYLHGPDGKVTATLVPCAGADGLVHWGARPYVETPK